MLNPQTKTLLNSVASNLTDAGKSYETADNLLLVGIATSIVGSLIYQKDKNLAKGLMFVGIVLNLSSLTERYDGHRNMKESGENLKNYSKSLK